ncbi:hypothetical protein FZC79_10540 [Rossellomorea vietnamensis]|uniref:Uncharacterized protein n=1 Tax=Rossellomorea vietnamensis TaxID=218284 RepID=A0A5D4KFA4_9BACI|nr:hypothetical protein [Rossellomorea vietnamensis]TYR75596.1 hypothetical protein FZC79_10540 [Rossellomorea vietnamensis]
MDPFTFGIVATGSLGGGLLLLAALDKGGFSINEDLLVIVVEVIKAGAILKFLSYISQLFI